MPNLVSIVGFPNKRMESLGTNGNVECESPAHENSMERILKNIIDWHRDHSFVILSKNMITFDGVLKVSGV